MKINAQLAALLLVAIPAMVAAAPVAAPGTAIAARDNGEIAEILQVGGIEKAAGIDVRQLNEINDEDGNENENENDDEENEDEDEDFDDEEEEEVTKRATADLIFARQGERDCGAPVPTDPAARAIYDGHMKDMAAATTKAHAGESMCKMTNWVNARKNKQLKQQVKDKCIQGYTQCIPARQAANAACAAAGGTISAGHKKSVTFCQTQLKQWQNKKIT